MVESGYTAASRSYTRRVRCARVAGSPAMGQTLTCSSILDKIVPHFFLVAAGPQDTAAMCVSSSGTSIWTRVPRPVWLSIHIR